MEQNRLFYAQSLIETAGELDNIDILNEAAAEEKRKDAEYQLKLIKSDKIMKDYMNGKLSKKEAYKIWQHTNESIKKIISEAEKIPPETKFEKIKFIFKKIATDLITVNGLMLFLGVAPTTVASSIQYTKIGKDAVDLAVKSGANMTKNDILHNIGLFTKYGIKEGLKFGITIIKPVLILYTVFIIFIDSIHYGKNYRTCNFNKNAVISKLKAYRTKINKIYNANYKNM